MSNGRLARSQLAPIHNGMLLRRDAAAAFNAMNAEARRRYGRNIGVRDAYRVLGSQGDLSRGRWSQWAAWERYRRGGNLAARPGTSNHGWGLALDLTPDGIQIVRAIGEKYGWAKKWSDAPSEPWHFRYRTSVWNGRVPNAPGKDRGRLKVLTKKERTLVQKRYHHYEGMAKERKTGKGRKYYRHLGWSRYYKARIAAQMAALRVSARRAGDGGWKRHNRGSRYQVLKAAYHHKLDL